MVQEPAWFGAEVEPGAGPRSGWAEPSDADPELPPQVVSTGIAHLIAPVADPDALARVRLDAAGACRSARAARERPCSTWRGAIRRGARATARGFFHGGEDPATGSAAGPLCAYLAARRGQRSVEIAQGVEMGRPSRIDASAEGERVRVGGDVVVLVEGTLRL